MTTTTDKHTVVAVTCKTEGGFTNPFVVRVHYADGHSQIAARGDAWIAGVAAKLEREHGLVSYAYGEEALAA